MNKIPQNVNEKLKNLGCDETDYWSLPQAKHITILTHKALERIAASE